jgi:hypothetical protein
MSRNAGSTPYSLVSAFLLLLAGMASAQDLRVEPDSLSLHGPAARHGLLVSAKSADGRWIDVKASIVSSKPDVVAVEADGSLRAVSDGAAELRVTHEGKTVAVPVKVAGTGQPTTPSFRHEVVPIFTRFGCSMGACHGKESGQNGFKLSLRGFAPEMDYEGILLESRGRRINVDVPDLSLFLAKASGRLPHKGGVLFAPDTRPYRRLAEWVGAGAPGLVAAEPALESLEVLGGRRLKTGQEQPLLAIARYADGSSRDVTWLCQYFSNDASVLEVAPDGRVKARREGATAIRAHYQDKVAVAEFSVPHDRPIDRAAFGAPKGEIDRHVNALLEEMRIPPSGPCSDADYVRRATLDATGTLPTPEQVRAFLADPAPDKREKLADALLASPEFTDYWALILGDLLQNRKERDHDVRGAKGVRAFHGWLRAQVAANRPWNELAKDVLLATGDTGEFPQIGYYVVTVGEQREADKSDLGVSVAQSFLGTRILCAKCHNHPDERYTQDDYYHFAAFFSRLGLDRKKPEKGATELKLGGNDLREAEKRIAQLEKELEKLEGKKLEEKRKQLADARKSMEGARVRPVRVTQPRTGKPMEARPLDRSAVEIAAGDDPRKALVAWMTDPKNGYFSGNMVNRVWKHYLGVGLVEPVDDLRPSNLPSNPGLWDHLRADFAKDFDLRRLMRGILTSAAYQRSSVTTPANELDRRCYSHYYARRLSAEVLSDAISRATGLPDAFPGYPVGVRAVQLPDPGLDSYFLDLFGRSPRVSACACEREGEVTLPQLLHMMNGDSVVKKINAGDGRLAKLLEAGDDAKALEELFLATLSRLPRETERSVFAKQLAAAENKAEAWRDLFWALLNSKEFVFNH